MKNKFLIIMAVILISAAFIFGENDKKSEFSTVEKDGFVFSWKVSGNSLDIKVSAPMAGWVSVGIDPSFRMKDADFIIGYVTGGKVFTRDDFGTTKGAHKPDEKLGGKDNISNASGSESGGRTEISFSIPLDSGDKYDKKIIKGKHTIILACSDNDNFTGFHKKTAKFEIEIN